MSGGLAGCGLVGPCLFFAAIATYDRDSSDTSSIVTELAHRVTATPAGACGISHRQKIARACKFFPGGVLTAAHDQHAINETERITTASVAA